MRCVVVLVSVMLLSVKRLNGLRYARLFLFKYNYIFVGGCCGSRTVNMFIKSSTLEVVLAVHVHQSRKCSVLKQEGTSIELIAEQEKRFQEGGKKGRGESSTLS